MPLWKTADVLAPSIALGSVFGRIGCLLNGCCYGRPTDVPWAITFTNPQAHELSGTPLDVPLHPTEIYDALLNFGLYRFSRLAVPAQKIRRPGFCDLSALLRRHALDCRILPRRLFQSPLPLRHHASAMDRRPDFHRRPRACGGSVASR